MKMKYVAAAILSLLVIGIGIQLHSQKKENLAPTPPMGWNSWNYFGCDVSEKLIKEMADAMVESGMAEAGYEYIVIDDCWQIGRDENGKIIEDPERFPSGMKALADYVHSKGLKFGIYSDAGKKTCQKRPGSYGYEAIDAKTYEEWGVDYLKYDWCFNGLFNTSKELYPIMAEELYKLDRPIVFSMCNWGRQNPSKWAGEYAHLWRTTWDIRPSFKGMGWHKSVMHIVKRQHGLEEYGGINGWNDPDMLQVGNGDLTADENRAHFSLWCMLAAPLMAGNDLRKMPDNVMQILTNKEAIAINQDVLGIQGYRMAKSKGFHVYVKELNKGEWAVCLLNHGKGEKAVDYNFQNALGLKKKLSVYDIWNDKVLGDSDDDYHFEMPRHSVVFVRLKVINEAKSKPGRH